MCAVNKNIPHRGNAQKTCLPTGKILLVGDLGKAFLDADAATKIRSEMGLAIPARGPGDLRICAGMTEAIDIAARENFAAIAIVMSGISAKLSSNLKALRDNCDAKIILLAQMYEEPIAIHIVNSIYNGRGLADDYFICPLGADSFYESITTSGRPGRTQAALHRTPYGASAAIATGVPKRDIWRLGVPTTTETRIRYLEQLATEDDLTGLKNRRYIWEFSRQIIEYAKNQNGRVTLLVFDVDDLKKYNDIYGHQSGDEILKEAAVLMRRCCRSHDVVGRIGGDEFAVIFWDDPQQQRAAASTTSEERRSANADHPAEAITIAKRFIKELGNAGLSGTRDPKRDISAFGSPTPSPGENGKWESSPFGGLGPEGKGVLTISGGLASFPRDGQTIEELFQQADKALLEAKRSGKNRIYLVGRPQSNINEID
jgi:diguanylate cyclase (GGDEF)-like protein